MKYFLGLDIALANNGICLLDENSNIIISDIIKTKTEDNIEKRILYLKDQIFEIMNKYKDINSIYMEGLSYGSSGNSFAQICGMHYYLRCSLFKNFNSTNFKVIEPTKLKKFITGKGQCKKDLILLCVYKNFGVEFDNDNLADAYGLSKMALTDFESNI